MFRPRTTSWRVVLLAFFVALTAGASFSFAADGATPTQGRAAESADAGTADAVADVEVDLGAEATATDAAPSGADDDEFSIDPLAAGADEGTPVPDAPATPASEIDPVEFNAPAIDGEQSPAAVAVVTPVESDLDPEVADVNEDGVVNEVDVDSARTDWEIARRNGDPCRLGAEGAANDVDGNGCLDGTDLDLIAGQFGEPVAARAMVAEPLVNEAVNDDIVVNTTADTADAVYNDGQCRTAAGTCSLRAAITQANASPGPDRIVFAIPTAKNAAARITVSSRLPEISDLTGGVTIDGYTQAGASPNTLEQGFNAVLKIEIIGNVVQRDILKITSAENVIRGLSIAHGQRLVTLTGPSAKDNLIAGNLIGNTITQNYRQENGYAYAGFYSGGVWLYVGANNNQIGTPDVADRNMVGGPLGYGFMIEQGGTSFNRIQNNIVGLRSDGGAVKMFRGFDVQWYSSDNQIGGHGLREGNVISSAFEVGVDMSHSSLRTKVIGNYFGTNFTGDGGTAAQGNKVGVELKDNSFDNDIIQNVIANSQSYGMYSTANYNRGTRIIDNRFGLGVNGTRLPNAKLDMAVNGTDDRIEGNTFANGDRSIQLRNDYVVGPHTNYPRGLTERNTITDNSFWRNSGMMVDILPTGVNANDAGDRDTGIQGLLNYPEIASLTSDTVTGTACAGCTVEVYLAAGAMANVRIAVTTADASGAFTVTGPAIAGSRRLALLAIDPQGNTSEFSPIKAKPALASVTPTSWAGGFGAYNVGGRTVIATANQGRSNTGNFPNTTSRLVFEVNAPSAGDYKILVDTYAASSTGNSFYFRINDPVGTANGSIWGNIATSAAVTTRTLTNTTSNVSTFSLKKGLNTIQFAPYEDGAGIASLRIEAASPPVPSTIDAVANQTNTVGDAVSLPVTAVNNTDGALLAFGTDGLPPGLAIDPVTGVISGTIATPGFFRTTVYGFDGFTTVLSNFTWDVGYPNRAPEFDRLGKLAATAGDSVNVQVAAVDPDGDALTYRATGLPVGLSISADGTISGFIESAGRSTSVITATDPSGLSSSVKLGWNITPLPFTCSVADGVLTWTRQVTPAYDVVHAYEGNETRIASQTKGGSLPVERSYGTYTVKYYTSTATIETSCDGPDAAPEPFTCTVDATTAQLRWQNGQSGVAYVGQIGADGSSTYVGASTTGNIAIPDVTGTYEVHYYTQGHIETTCSGQPAPVEFTCAVDAAGGVLRWQNGQSGPAYVGLLRADGSSTYIGASSTGSIAILDLAGTYEVHQFTNGQIQTTCSGDSAAAFSCSVDAAAGQLRWVNGQSGPAYVGLLAADGSSTYIGASTTGSIAIPDVAGTYEVHYYTNGHIETTCSGAAGA